MKGVGSKNTFHIYIKPMKNDYSMKLLTRKKKIKLEFLNIIKKNGLFIQKAYEFINKNNITLQWVFLEVLISVIEVFIKTLSFNFICIANRLNLIKNCILNKWINFSSEN